MLQKKKKKRMTDSDGEIEGDEGAGGLREAE